MTGSRPRVLQNLPGERLLTLGHRGERDLLRALGNAEQDAGVLNREETLRDDDEEPHGESEGADGDGERQTLVAQPQLRSVRRSR